MTNPHLEFLVKQVDDLKQQGLFNTIRTIESAQGAHIKVNGKEVINFCSNNYLGIANHPKLIKAAVAAVKKFGAGPAAVRTIAGTLPLHLELEDKIAKFKKVDAALVVQSGFVANQATIPALMGKEDVIFTDKLNHASIIDACRLSGATIVIYDHCSVDDLKTKIESELSKYRRGMVVTDGVFSMDGDIAPLKGIYELCKRYGLISMVDDAHGEGVLGQGRGIVEHFGLHGKFDIEIGTFSKAFGVVGGVIAGKQEIIDWLRQRGRTFLFSSASTPADTAACIAAVDLIESNPKLVKKLWDNTKYFKEGLVKLGFNTGRSETPITPIIFGENKTAQDASKLLFEEGIFAMPIIYPTVPQGTARIRVMISAAHSKADLDRGIAAFTKVGKELSVI